jgi:NADPH:quinone reductase-like Zn-dependent oxidoreductase
MKAGVVFDLAEGPVWADFIEPQPAPGQTLIDVRAAAMSHVVKARASGRHYSFDGNLPFVPGIDGVGTTSQGLLRLPHCPLRQYGAAGAGRPAELPAAAG